MNYKLNLNPLDSVTGTILLIISSLPDFFATFIIFITIASTINFLSAFSSYIYTLSIQSSF